MKKQFQIPPSPKVLIVGNGAREHAVAWKLAQSVHAPQLYVAPGNAGLAGFCSLVDISTDDVERLVTFAQTEAIDLVFVGPEVPLSLGIADACTRVGIRVFGPCERAAQLEASKAAAKAWMAAAKVPTASCAVFQDAEPAKAFIRQHGAPIVVKADGLAAGKGVVVAQTVEEACDAVDEMLVDARFGTSGKRIVVESCLRGEEVSMMFFVDAHTAVPMVPARDYKRVGEGNVGPNTGGMGAFAPVTDFVEGGFVDVVESSIVRPILQALHNDGIVYRGVLYVGLMMTADGPFVIEFNCRFGDPETQVVLPLLDSDLLDILWAVTEDNLGSVDVQWSSDHAVCVVLAAHGYPLNSRTGDVIRFSEREAQTDIVFHAGTGREDGEIVTAGGRVLAVVGCGGNVASARHIAYQAADDIYFEGKLVRRDIALFE